MGARSGGGAGVGGVGGNVPKSVLNIEASIKNESREHLYVFSQSGKIVGTSKGTNNSVSLDSIPKSSIITHNHPAGGDLSIDDIKSAIKCDAAEIRAVTKTGVFSVKRPKEGWGVTAEQFGKSYKEEFQRLSSHMSERVQKEGYGWLKGQQPFSYVSNNAVKATTRKYNIKHTFN